MIQVVTNQGVQALASALTTGAAIEFTRYSVGNGVFSPSTMDAASMTSLISQVTRFGVTMVRKETSGVKVVADANNTTIPGGMYIRETGLFAKLNGGTEFLFAYGYFEQPEYVPPRAESLYERRFTSQIAMAEEELELVVTFNSYDEAIFGALGFTVIDGELCQTYLEGE